MSSASQTPTNYEAFWPFYLSEHKHRRTRQLHVLGTLLGVFTLILALLTLNFGWVIIALAFGYGFAWVAHAMIEKNRPATFSYPLWSFRADFRMVHYWLTGRLETELVKYKIVT